MDSNLLMSCGKDCRSICWNPNSGELLCEVPALTPGRNLRAPPCSLSHPSRSQPTNCPLSNAQVFYSGYFLCVAYTDFSLVHHLALSLGHGISSTSVGFSHGAGCPHCLDACFWCSQPAFHCPYAFPFSHSFLSPTIGCLTFNGPSESQQSWPQHRSARTLQCTLCRTAPLWMLQQTLTSMCRVEHLPQQNC